MQSHERADVEKTQKELTAAKAALASAIAETRELEHKAGACLLACLLTQIQ